MDIDNWKLLLESWGRHWFAARDLLDPEEADDDAVVAGSLGFPAATG
ncbi:hypothetical protein [Streptomyces sp. NPDC088141]